MEETPQPSPNPTHPIPGGGNPIEINTDDLHSKPEVDIGTSPAPVEDPNPDGVPDQEPPAPDTNPQ